MELVTFWFGSFLTKEGKVVRSTLFPKDAKAIATRLDAITKGDVLDEERELAQGSKALQVFEERLARLGEFAPLEQAPRDRNANDHGFTRALLHQAALEASRKMAAQAFSRRDLAIAQEVRALDEMIKTSNLLSERLREWFALHFPEALQKINENEKLASLVAENPDRDVIAAKLSIPVESLGAELDPSQRENLHDFAKGLHEAYATKARVEERLKAEAQQLMPNLSIMLGPVLAARFVAFAGGLERLASMPSSTIQTLGAENALFRHIREGAKPPKHGLTFQHIRVNTSPWWLRGRISRTLSASVATAAKADAYTHNDVATKLLAAFEKRVADLLAKNPRPPPPKFRGPPPRAYGGPPPRSGGPGSGLGGPPRREPTKGPPRKKFQPKGRGRTR